MIRTFCCAVAFFESKKIRMRKIVRMCAEMMLGLLLVSCGVSELGEYAKDKNVMLLLTTHRLDLAEDLATKRYHIKNGVLEQVPVKEKTNEER